MWRASYYLLGAILTQYEELVFTYPGGCSFQERPINYHLDAFRNLGFDIKNEEDKILFRKVKKESDKLRAKLNREPTVNEIADVLGIPAEEVTQAINASSLVKSLDSNEAIRNKAAVNSEEKTLNKIAILQVLDKLDTTDRQLITLRYFKDKTQNDTAKALGLSQVQVSRKEKIILKTLRNQLSS